MLCSKYASSEVVLVISIQETKAIKIVRNLGQSFVCLSQIERRLTNQIMPSFLTLFFALSVLARQGKVGNWQKILECL